MSPTLTSPDKENSKVMAAVYENLIQSRPADLGEYGQSSLGISKRNSGTNSEGRLEP